MIKFSEWVIKESAGSLAIGNVLLKIKKGEYEYIVQWIEDGTVDDNKSYYASGLESEDLEDAIGTMKDMAQRVSARSDQPIRDASQPWREIGDASHRRRRFVRRE